MNQSLNIHQSVTSFMRLTASDLLDYVDNDSDLLDRDDMTLYFSEVSDYDSKALEVLDIIETDEGWKYWVEIAGLALYLHTN